MELCEYCRRWSGIYLQANRCCQVRGLALAPKAARLARYAAERAARGADAERQLREQVAAEYRRWQESRQPRTTPT